MYQRFRSIRLSLLRLTSMLKGLLNADSPRARWAPRYRQPAVGRRSCSFIAALVLIMLEMYAHIYGSVSVIREVCTSAAHQIQRLGNRPLVSIREERYRYEHLLYLLDHYGNADLPNLDAIFISWGLGQVDPPQSLNLSNYRVPVYLQRGRENSLNERFRIPLNLRTEAALWTDDDIRVEASSVELLFEVWRSYGRPHHRIVGPAGRLASSDDGGPLRYTFTQSSTNIVLTNFAFMDKTMMNWYWESDRQLSQARKFVSQVLNCEDILMNYVVARRTGLSPVKAPVSGEFKNIESTGGISTKPGHVNRRTLCVREFERLFGPVLKRSSAVLSTSPATDETTENIVKLPQQWQPTGHRWGEGKTFL